jgi:hypothetical protein
MIVDDEYDDFDDDFDEEELHINSQKLREILEDNTPLLTTSQYIAIFTLPALVSFFSLNHFAELDILFSAIVSLAVMNGSINSVIAWMTIRLDDKSGQALKHLNIINKEMARLEDTLDEANEMVSVFTGDLEEAKSMFAKVGVDLNGLDLEPVAEVVEKLKENKDGFNEVLDNMKGVDISHYIDRAKGIDWNALLNAAEEVLTFIKGKQSTVPDMTEFKPTLPSPDIEPLPEMDDLDLPGMFIDEGGIETMGAPIVVAPTPPPALARKKPLMLRRR